MAIMAKKKKGEYSTPPEGLYSAVCVDVVDLGLVKTQWGENYKVQIRWQLEEQDPESDPQRPYMVLATYTNSLHEKSRLRPMLEAWRGRKFSAEELDGFDLEKLLGVNCQVQVIHNITDKGTYANVQAVVPAPRNAMKLRASEDYIRVCDRTENGNGHSNTEITDEDIPF